MLQTNHATAPLSEAEPRQDLFVCGMPFLDRELFWTPGSEPQKHDRISQRSASLLPHGSLYARGLSANDPAQRGNGLFCLRRPGMAEIESQAVAEPAVVGEHRPRCDADLVGQRLPIDGECVYRVPRHVDPHEVSALRPSETDVTRKMPGHRIDQRLFLPLHCRPQLTQVPVITTLLKILSQGGLGRNGAR